MRNYIVGFLGCMVVLQLAEGSALAGVGCPVASSNCDTFGTEMQRISAALLRRLGADTLDTLDRLVVRTNLSNAELTTLCLDIRTTKVCTGMYVRQCIPAAQRSSTENREAVDLVTQVYEKYRTACKNIPGFALRM